MGIIEGSTLTPGAGLGRTRRAVGLYDFAVDGGAVSDITLRGDTIPSGAVIVDALIQVDTILASSGAATVAIKTQSAADINAADAFDGAPWSTTGPKRADFTATSAPIKTTAARAIVATVAGAALTGGKFTVAVEYVLL